MEIYLLYSFNIISFIVNDFFLFSFKILLRTIGKFLFIFCQNFRIFCRIFMSWVYKFTTLKYKFYSNLLYDINFQYLFALCDGSSSNMIKFDQFRKLMIKYQRYSP